jgi:eukaryotic-like serine/threonine-protein kinase
MPVEVSTRKDCPTNDELRKLVREQLPAPRLTTLTNHLDDCPGCRSRLDDLSTDGDVTFSQQLRGINKSTPPRESAFWNAMSQAELALTGTLSGDDFSAATQDDLKFDFLEPSTLPGRIGKLGAFEVSHMIGRGGMGVVLQAYDGSLQRDVAIKVLDPQLATNQLYRQRFCREARTAASLSHDNIVAVYQVNELSKSGLPYLVMQLVHGETLEDRLKRVGRLTPAEAVRIGMQAAAGLAAAHANKLIHRDVKPANILIEAETNKVKLTDFGLARAVEDVKLTRTGFVAGTPLYMAPEQARGDAVDPRSDLFSLGSVLYESLSGRPPFDGKTPLVVLKRLTDEDYEPLHKVNPEVPEWFEDVIDKLLEKDPENRFQTAQEVADVLSAKYMCMDPAAAEMKAQVCGVQSATRILTSRRRSVRQLAVALAATFLFGAFVGGLATFALDPFSTSPRSSEGKTGLSVAGSLAPEPVKAEPQGPEPVASTRRFTGAVWAICEANDGKLIAIGLEDGKVQLWDRSTSNTGSISEIMAHDGPVWSVDLSPDGKTLITASDDALVKVWDLTEEPKEVRRFDNKTSLRTAALSSNKKHIVTGDRMGKVRLWDLANPSDKPVKETTHRGGINALAFSADGELVGIASSRGTAGVWDVSTGRRRPELTGHKGPVYGIAFTPDGTKLATASWDHSVRVWDAGSSQLLKTFEEAHPEGIWGISFACCGNFITTAGQEGLVRVWDVSNGNRIAEFSRHTGTVHVSKFTSGGTSILSGGRDGTVKVWAIDTSSEKAK